MFLHVLTALLLSVYAGATFTLIVVRQEGGANTHSNINWFFPAVCFWFVCGYLQNSVWCKYLLNMVVRLIIVFLFRTALFSTTLQLIISAMESCKCWCVCVCVCYSYFPWVVCSCSLYVQYTHSYDTEPSYCEFKSWSLYYHRFLVYM